MNTVAVVFEEPERLVMRQLELDTPGDEDVVVAIEWSGVSTGTERLLWSGRMPGFPGMGYPLVPGYESVGRILHAGARSGRRVGERVFVPGSRCFGDVRGLFGGAASRVVVPGSRSTPIGDDLEERGVMLALAATAYHAITTGTAPRFGAGRCPDLIVGHGVLGRLLARLTRFFGGEAPTVWERDPARAVGAEGYRVVDPADDARHDYRVIFDVSGDASLLDSLIARLAPGGEIVLAGFYSEPLSFAFAPAFKREVRMRIAAEWRDTDLIAVVGLVGAGQLSLDGLITHREHAREAPRAYRTAFTDPRCLKMILDWRACS